MRISGTRCVNDNDSLCLCLVEWAGAGNSWGCLLIKRAPFLPKEPGQCTLYKAEISS